MNCKCGPASSGLFARGLEEGGLPAQVNEVVWERGLGPDCTVRAACFSLGGIFFTPLVRLSSPPAVYALAGARGCMYAYARASVWRCPQDDTGRSFRHLHV